MFYQKQFQGFTLIELLVVVLIIGILAAIALPQHQKAVLKSRYSALMPIASAVANGQEIYYMEKGNYSSDITKLDIKAPSGGANANVEVSDGTDERFEYVLATKDDLPGLAYVIYQKRSPQFPDTVMCEANDELNSKATWLCKDALKGKEEESGSLLGTGWTAYIIKGTEGQSTFLEPGACMGSAPTMTASKSGATSTAECVDGEWKFLTWTDGDTFRFAHCDGDTAHACSGAIVVKGHCTATAEGGCSNGQFSGAGTYCWAHAENGCVGSTFTDGSRCEMRIAYPGGCAGSTFSGNGTYCFAWAENGCTGSTFTDGAYCYGWATNGCSGAIIQEGAHCRGQGRTGCSGAIIQSGGYCDGNLDNTHNFNVCAGAIIQDGGWCEGRGCDQAIYEEGGCCKGDYCGDKPICAE